MKKQEAIEKLESRAFDVEDTDLVVGLRFAQNTIKQIDEPEKPVVPQFVAEWYEANKDAFEYNLYRLCIDFHERKLHEDLHEWFTNNKNKPIEVLILMNKYGYEVEKEKLYTVEIPNQPNAGHLVLTKDNHGGLFIDWRYTDSWKEFKKVQLTEAEIKKDFDWAWQFAEEVKE